MMYFNKGLAQNYGWLWLHCCEKERREYYRMALIHSPYLFALVLPFAAVHVMGESLIVAAAVASILFMTPLLLTRIIYGLEFESD